MFSFKNLESWIGFLKKYNPNIPIILVGSKADLIDKISVQDEYALETKEKYNFIEFLNNLCYKSYILEP